MGRFAFVLALLSAAAVVNSSHLHGDGRNKPDQPVVQPAARFQEEADALARAKFDQAGVLTYKPLEGDCYFAVKLQTALPVTPPRHRDLLILVSNSAAQAGDPWITSGQIAAALSKQTRPGDRISLWTISTPDDKATRCLTRDFVSPQDDKRIADALHVLRNRQFPAGDTDLKGGLRKVIDSFDGQVEARQRIILFLGDGQSTHDPMTSGERQALCKEMADRKIVFMPVPLGVHLDASNLHGLATGTGGAVIRVNAPLALQGRGEGGDPVDDTCRRCLAAFDQPILYPSRLQMPAQVIEIYPRTLPPLRADVPTLVAGRCQPVEKLSWQIEGRLAGRFEPLIVSGVEEVRPPELDNYFLVSMVSQWQRASDQPALIRADRALAFASEQNRLHRLELIASGQLAVQENHLAVAEELFEQARKLAPHEREARAGLKIVADLRAGRLTRDQLRDQLEQQKLNKIDKVNGQLRWTQIARLDPENAVDAAPAPRGEDLLHAQRDRIVVEEQKMTQMVEDNLKQARRELFADPDTALDRLRSALLRVRDHPELGNRVRQALLDRLDTTLRNIVQEGRDIKQRQLDASRRKEQSVKQDRREQQRQTAEQRLTAQFRIFNDVLNRARMEEMTRQQVLEGLLRMAEDARLKGVSPPVVASAAYTQVEAGYNLNKYHELKTQREKRFLEAYLSVEKSHVPFADEPGLYYPPLAMWQALTDLRKEKYEVFTVPDDEAGRREVNSVARLLDEVIDMKDFQHPMSMKEALELLHDKLAAAGKDLPVLVDAEAFKAADPDAPDIFETQVKFPPFPRRMSVAIALRLALSQVPQGNATYLIRRDMVEITTIERQTQERVLRVYPVQELVVPISQQSALAGFGQFGQLGAVGAPGFGQFNQFGFPGGQLGQFGQFGGQFGQFGAAGFGQFGQFGAPGFGQFGQLGQFPGGQLGFPGFGQLGQFGQFGGGNFGAGGLQGFNGGLGMVGATQAADLINVITRLVAPGEWFTTQQLNPQVNNPFNNPFNQQPFGVIGFPGPVGGPPAPVGQGGPANIQDAHTIEFLPTALALVVRAPARHHYSHSGGLFGKAKRALNDPFARAGNNKGQLQVANAGDAPKEKRDPEVIWNEALAKGKTAPGLIIATAAFLFEAGHPDHAAEFLKANLRQGIVIRPWVYEALAVALEQCQADIDEIRRARLSAVALDPHDALGFLEAARTMSRHKEWDRALAFCRQASLLEPGLADPYADALAYAEMNRDQQSMAWAIDRLLGHDWPADNSTLHLQAQAKAETLARILEEENRPGDAARLRDALRRLKRRDLVVNVTWTADQQSADVDVVVKEPCGSVATFEQRQTPGGGALQVSNLQQTNGASYTAAEAFSGPYQITLRRNWGQPFRNQARIEIIRHQGTAAESKHVEVVSLDQPRTLTINLAAGRRTMLASVPATMPKRAVSEPVADSHTQVLTRLRALAAADFSASDDAPRMEGNSATPGARLAAASANSGPRIAQQRTVASPIGIGWNLQTAVSADQSQATITLQPAFQTLPRSPAPVQLAVIPGG